LNSFRSSGQGCARCHFRAASTDSAERAPILARPLSVSSARPPSSRHRARFFSLAATNAGRLSDATATWQSAEHVCRPASTGAPHQTHRRTPREVAFVRRGATCRPDLDSGSTQRSEWEVLGRTDRPRRATAQHPRRPAHGLTPLREGRDELLCKRRRDPTNTLPGLVEVRGGERPSPDQPKKVPVDERSGARRARGRAPRSGRPASPRPRAGHR
jgi:hypothetical protein